MEEIVAYVESLHLKGIQIVLGIRSLTQVVQI